VGRRDEDGGMEMREGGLWNWLGWALIQRAKMHSAGCKQLYSRAREGVSSCMEGN
jgi:hypothetical protein